jgi:hypothetical protein
MVDGIEAGGRRDDETTEACSLRGKLLFAGPQCFGRFGVFAIKALSARANARPSENRVTDLLRAALQALL